MDLLSGTQLSRKIGLSGLENKDIPAVYVLAQGDRAVLR